MWWELYIVLCGAVKGRLENREEMNKTQWLINVFPPQTSGWPTLSPSPWMTEHNWLKSKLNYIHSSIYKNIPSTLYMYYSRIKQKIKSLKRPKSTYRCFYPLVFQFFYHYNDIFSNCCWCCQLDFSPCSGFLSSSDISAAFLNQL